ncbi:hypothetical protein L3Q82_000610 [Scortum barcoo]|uniref:Uncharacterized protein n=1 Tax=Scortum barcoo TaxID=214431 RepID=A0ACB8WIF2_9TELE|nr:hypothetical protein L3Q82_000610 [Scortum barcoo]
MRPGPRIKRMKMDGWMDGWMVSIRGLSERLTGPLLDPLQSAYRANRSVDDAVNTGVHYILQHLDSPLPYARILFVDFCLVFNTIIPDVLQSKFTQFTVPAPTCQWITNFLTDRRQQFRGPIYYTPTQLSSASSGKEPPPTSVILKDKMSAVETFRFLGSTVSNPLWEPCSV